jgi:mannan endo-1,4-beta-mannosidase
MAWELANEPRGFHNNTADFNLWIDNTAAFIKSLDPNHLVTTGSEGNTPWPFWNGLNFISNHNGSNIDYTTVHIWPQNWGWYDPANPQGTYDDALEKARDYFRDHVFMAVTLNKPLVLEEFGLARDGGSYDPQAGTTMRDGFFEAMYSEVYDSASFIGPAAGDNFWAWAGEARPLEPYGGFWERGDPWIGDPSHEHQGWYSVYDADTATLNVIKRHAWVMNSLFKPPCEADFEPNGVVDGKDLAEFIARFVADLVDEDDLADLAEDFGRTDCPLEFVIWPNS